MPKIIKLVALSIRDLFISIGPPLLIVAVLLILAYRWIDPQPPKTVTMATGPAGSAYAEFGKRYAAALKANGIEVVLKPTDGSLNNLELLRKGEADVAFVRGGSADVAADEEAGLLSLGALFYEPLWVFYRAELEHKINHRSGPLTRLTQLKGLRVNVDKPGSGVPAIMGRLLRVNRLDAEGAVVLSHLEPEPATAALEAGLVDAIVLASAPQSPLVKRLLRLPDIALMDFDPGEAYVRRFDFLSEVTLPHGVVDLAADLPPRDVALLATTTSLLSREQTHPALRQLFAQAAQSLHSRGGYFNRARDFPNTRTSELPVSAEGDRVINGRPSFWQRYLPFWASNLMERMWLVIGGLVVLMLPLSRIIPPVYRFQVRRRVFRWYGQLREIEQRVDTRNGELKALLHELDELERTVDGITVPLSYTDELYALRSNIQSVRERLLATWA